MEQTPSEASALPSTPLALDSRDGSSPRTLDEGAFASGCALANARRLRELGFSVVPISPGGKHPNVAWQPLQHAAASDRQLVEWFDTRPHSNVGIVTGAVSGVVVVDTDTVEAEDWAATHLPPTPMWCKTARGTHRYYRHPGRSVPNRAQVTTANGSMAIDIRGDGGLVVAPGSVHARGHVYAAAPSWPDDLEAVPAFDPEWFAPGAVECVSKAQLGAPNLIPQGERNDRMYRLARRLRAQNLSSAAIRAALAAENHQKCVPPLSEQEIDSIAAHAMEQPDRLDVAASEGRFPPSWRLLDDVDLMTLPDPEYLIDEILPRKGLSVIFGQPGTCKTTLVAAILGSVATGRPLFGRRVRQKGAAVYMAMEDPSGFKSRLRAWKADAGVALDTPSGVYTFPAAIDLRDLSATLQFERFLKETPFPQPLALIVIDTYAAATPGANENSAEDATLALAHAEHWKESLGVTVLLVHHSNASGSRERGHSALRGAADNMVAMSISGGEIRVECSKQRNGPAFAPITLKLVPHELGGCLLQQLQTADGSNCDQQLSANERKVLAGIQRFGATVVSMPEWKAATQGVPERTFYRLAKDLVAKKHVRKMGKKFQAVARDP